jgi:hypothetical protein
MSVISQGDKVKFYTDIWCDGKWIVGRVVHIHWTAGGQYATVQGRSGREYEIPTGQLESAK